MNEEYSDMFSELSGHSGSKEYERMTHRAAFFVGRTYEKWMDQQYTDLLRGKQCRSVHELAQ